MRNPIHHPVDFRLFLIVWNRIQAQDTPSVHLRMADWLQARWTGGDTRLLLMAFRSCGKSTIVGLFAAWLLYARPDLRILVLAAEGTLAERMVRNVRRIIERHPLTARLKPDRPDQWARDRFTVRRGLELRDPSMMARGIDANITGSRADIIICDDVEVPRTCDTAAKRAVLRELLLELEFILVPGGTLLYVGTPHHWFTIYADEPRAEIGETRLFLAGYRRFSLPLLDSGGNSAWPERYSTEAIEKMRRGTGPNKFASQMLLRPVNAAEGRLDPACLQQYGHALHYNRELNVLLLAGRRLVSCSAYWDPAFGGNDGSVLAVVFADDSGGLWLHRVQYLAAAARGGPGGEDVARAQCRQVAETARDLMIPCVTVETNGIGGFLPGILRGELSKSRVPCAVVERHNTRPKDLRILDAFDTPLAARMLHVHDSVLKTPFLNEMQEWRPGLKHARDDGLDAVAGAIAAQPIQLRTERFAGRQSWHGGAAFTAKTEFEV